MGKTFKQARHTRRHVTSEWPVNGKDAQLHRRLGNADQRPKAVAGTLEPAGLCSALEESPEQAVWRAGRGRQEAGLARAPGAVGLGTVAGFCSCVVGSDSHRWGLLTDCVLEETSPERPKCLARMAGGDVSEVGRLERE